MKNQNMEKQPKTRWHLLLSKMLEEILIPVGIEVHIDLDIMSESPRVDILLIKRTKGTWLPKQTARLPDGIRSSRAKHILLEFKYSESVNGDVFEQALCYKKFYKQSRKLKEKDVQIFLISSKTTRKEVLTRFGYSLSETSGVYMSSNPFVKNIPILSLNELADKPYNAFFKCFASKVREKRKAFSMLEQWKSGINSNNFWQFIYGLSKICLIKGGDVMKEITPDTLIKIGKEMGDLFLATLPIEKRLQGLTLEERLQGFTLEEIEALLQRYKKKI